MGVPKRVPIDPAAPPQDLIHQFTSWQWQQGHEVAPGTTRGAGSACVNCRAYNSCNTYASGFRLRPGHSLLHLWARGRLLNSILAVLVVASAWATIYRGSALVVFVQLCKTEGASEQKTGTMV